MMGFPTGASRFLGVLRLLVSIELPRVFEGDLLGDDLDLGVEVKDGLVGGGELV